METNARFTLIGAFTLAVIAIGFSFVYWLHAIGGVGQRTQYRIRYDGPVSGLLKGSAVLFNGLRVGEVTAMKFDPASPSGVLVDIAVDKLAPVRADSAVGMDFQGLTGAPVVTIAGGSPNLPLLTNAKEIPLLVADKNAGQGMTQAAREVLRNIDKVVTDNAEPLKSLIANFDKFSGALARNSDKVDGLVAGLEKLTGGGAKQASQFYPLTAATVAINGPLPTTQLQVAEPTALSMLDTDKIAVIGAPNGKPVFENGQWPDLLPKVLQARLVETFENSRFPSVVGKIPDLGKSDFQLAIEIRHFEVSAPNAIADVELAAKLFGGEGKLVASKSFRSSTPVGALEVKEGAKALDATFRAVASDIVRWVLTSM